VADVRMGPDFLSVWAFTAGAAIRRFLAEMNSIDFWRKARY
jgi:hypothetical protein